MIKKYLVFWLGTERTIYGDDSYYVLGDLMTSCDTEEDAIKYIESLNLKLHQLCTILPIWVKNK